MQDTNEFLNFIINNYQESANELYNDLKKWSNRLDFL